MTIALFFLGVAAAGPDGRGPGLGIDELLRAARAAVENRQLMARVEQPARDGFPHLPETDDGNSHLAPFLRSPDRCFS